MIHLVILWFFVVFLIVGKQVIFGQSQVLIWIQVLDVFTGSMTLQSWQAIESWDIWYTDLEDLILDLWSTSWADYFVTWDIQNILTGTEPLAFDKSVSVQLFGTDWLKIIHWLYEPLNTGTYNSLVLKDINIFLDQTGPTIALLLVPWSGETIYGSTSFSWSSSIDSWIWLSNYKYFIARNSDITDIVFVGSTQNTWFSTNVNALWAWTYYWIVVAEDLLGNETTSLTWSFVVWEIVGPDPTPSVWSSENTFTHYDYCPNWDFSQSYYDGLCTSSEFEIIDPFYIRKNISTSDEEVFFAAEEELSGYPLEFYSAYKYAYHYSMTTIAPIEDANLYWPLVRKEFAKIIVQYVENVMWLEANIHEYCTFDDVENESDEMKYFMLKSCQHGLMWLYYDWEPSHEFFPNEPVSKAMFSTILSRLFRGDMYNWNSNNRYIDHMTALQRASVMDEIYFPQDPELRIYAFIMLKRADEYGFVDWRMDFYEKNP